MDSISNAELLELILLQRQNVDFQFQFWLTITFALIAATFAAGNRVSVTLKILVAGVYFLATVSLIGRYALEGAELGSYLAIAIERELIPDPIAWPLFARGAAVLIGTVGALAYLFSSKEKSDGQP